MSGLRGSVTGLRGSVSGLRGSVSGLRGRRAGLRGRGAGLRGSVSGLRARVAGLRGRRAGPYWTLGRAGTAGLMACRGRGRPRGTGCNQRQRKGLRDIGGLHRGAARPRAGPWRPGSVPGGSGRAASPATSDVLTRGGARYSEDWKASGWGWGARRDNDACATCDNFSGWRFRCFP